MFHPLNAKIMMTINYDIAKRPVLGSENGEEKWFAHVKNGEKVTNRNLIFDIAKATSLTSTDVMGVLESLFTDIPDHLLRGRTVVAGDLGTFYLTVRSEGTENEEDFSAYNIKKVSIRFRPSKYLKNRIAGANFIKYENGNHK